VKRIETLAARASFLEARIAERGREHAASGYDKAEMFALRWALPILEGHVTANRILHEQLREEKDERSEY
jgi:hypothetical protein